MAPIELTRRALYDQVWSKPMRVVAEEYGISDVALKKICIRCRVPSPERGYWAKKAAGKPVKQIRFVDTANPIDERVLIHGSNRPDLPAPIRQHIDDRKSARKIDRKTTSVPDEVHSVPPLAESHKAIIATARALRASRSQTHDERSAIGQGLCGVTLGIVSVDRAINVLNSLAHALRRPRRLA